MSSWLLTNANDILIDLNGKKAYLEDDALWTYAAGDNTMPTAVLTFNKTDLGEPGIDKLFNEFILDYVGTWRLNVYDDNSSSPVWDILLPTQSSRALRKVFFPLANRRAFKKMHMTLTSNDYNTKLYGIEIDFQILRQRSYA